MANPWQAKVEEIFADVYGNDPPKVTTSSVCALVSHHTDCLDDEDPEYQKRMRKELSVLEKWLKSGG